MLPAPSRSGDAVAISLSGLCLIHCLALPVLAGSLPLLAIWAEAEWMHMAFVVLAAPVSLWTLSRPPRESLPKTALILALTGCGLLISGVAAIDDALETLLTVAGGLSLAAAHLINWRRRSGAGRSTPRSRALNRAGVIQTPPPSLTALNSME